MANNIEKRIVEMQFDNRQFESGVKTSLSTIDKLKEKLNFTGATKGLDDIGRATKNVGMDGLGVAVETVRVKFSALQVMAITALTNITNSAVNAGKKMVSALTIDPIKTGYQEYETQINAIQTILANTSAKGTSLNQVNAALNELNHYADLTIYNFTEMTRNIGTFTAAGVDLDTSVSAIKGIANLAAVSGSTSQQASTAMYQLSQALASGTVKLQDWNSVVNAGMGGEVFQNALKETARAHGTAIDDMITSEGSFRETLKDGWLTSQVLTETLAKFTGDLNEKQLKAQGYTQEQIVEIMKLGDMANKAATEVKTFSQLWETLQEAAQSGWTQSWEIIVGDFNEAKELLTYISDTVSDLIGVSADSRNKMLSGGLSSGWKQFLRQGIPDEERYIEAVKKTAKEQGISVDKMIEKKGSFNETLKSGWLTADIMTKSLTDMTKEISSMSEEQLEQTGLTADQIKELKKLNEQLQNGSISIEDFVNKINRPSGRENLIEALKNSFNGLLNIIKPIKEAFRDIFPKYTGDQLYELTVRIKELSEKFKVSATTIQNIKSTFRGLFSVLGIVKEAISGFLRAVIPAFDGVGNLASKVLEVTAAIGDWIYSLYEYIKANDIFYNNAKKVVDFVTNAWSLISETAKLVYQEAKTLIETFAKKINFPGVELIHNLLERIQERMSQVGEATSEMKSGFSIAMEVMSDSIKDSKLAKLIGAFGEGLKVVGKGIISVLKVVSDTFFDFIGDINFNNVLDILNGFIAGGIGLGIKKFIDNLADVTKGFSSITDGIVDVLDGVRGSLEAYQSKLKSEALLKIAAAIAILAAAVIAISLVDSNKLSASLGAITVLFADLMGSMMIFNKMTGGGMKGSGKLTMLSVAMVGVATSILILSVALKKIGDLDFGAMATGLTGVIGLTMTMVKATKSLSGVDAVKGTIQLVIFAGAILILSTAVTKLAQLDIGQLAKGLVGVGVLIGEITLFLKFAKTDGKMLSTAIGIVILSSAMLILAKAVEKFGSMDWSEIGKGLTAVGVLLGEMVIFSKLTKNASGMVSMGISLIAISAAMIIFAKAVQEFSSMDWEELKRGLAGMAGVLVSLAVSLRMMPKNLISMGAGLLIISSSLLIMAKALSNFGSMQWDEIKRGLTALGGALVILAVGLRMMKNSIAGSAALVIAAGALLILTPVLSILGAMSWSSIIKGLTTLAGVFIILGVAGAVLTPLVPTILGLSGAIALIGLSVVGIGVGLLAAGAGLSAIAIGITALATSLAAGSTAIVAALSIIITGIVGLIPAVLIQIGKGIIAFADVIAKGAPALGEAFKALVLTAIDVLVECIPPLVDGILLLITSTMQAIVKYTPQVIDAIFDFIIGVIEGLAKRMPELIKVAIDAIMILFAGIIDAIAGLDVDTLIKGLAGIGLLSGIMLALSAIAGLIPAAMVGVLGMGLVVAELALVLGAIGLFAQLPGLKWLIDEGGELLGSIGKAIGSFIGGIVGGFMGGVTSSFPKMGMDLSLFMINLQPFIVGASKIDSGVMDGVKSLAEVVLILTAANLLDGLTKWITGGTSIVRFGEELAEFGPHFNRYYQSIKGVDGTVVQASANAALALAEMAKKLPNQGGVVGWFTGENSLADFADELVIFGPKLKQYSDSVKGLNSTVVINSANAALALAEMAENLPNKGGVVSWFTGDNSLSAFADELAEFGPVLKRYSDSVKGLDAGLVINSTRAAQALSEIATNLPNQGGVVSWFTGDNSLSSFGKEIAEFGPHLKLYSDSIKGLDSTVVVNSTNAAKALSELATNLPNQGGIASWFSGDNKLKDFGKGLKDFGGYFYDYYIQVKDINAGGMSASTREFGKIIDVAKNVNNVNVKGFGDFGDSLTKVGKSGVDGFIKAFTGSSAKVTKAVGDMITAFDSGINSRKSTLNSSTSGLVTSMISTIDSKQATFKNSGSKSIIQMNAGISSQERLSKNAISNLVSSIVNDINNKRQSFYTAGQTLITRFVDGMKTKNTSATTNLSNIINELLTLISNKHSQFQNAGKEAMSKFASGVSSNSSKVTTAFTKDISKAVTGVNSYYNQFHASGKYVVQGFANGIKAYTYLAEARSRAMASAALRAARIELQERSPSKAFYEVGDYAGLGFVNALDHYASIAYRAGSKMASSATTGLNATISAITDSLNGNMDMQPTIRPVLDLSDVQSKASQLNNMMGRGYSMDLAYATADSMSSSRIAAYESSLPSSTTNNDTVNHNVFNITSNNPKEVANEVSRILQQQVERKEATWA